MPERTKEGKYRGVIYEYRNNESGLSYVGKADNEANRRSQWNKPKSNAYAGMKIAAARKQYGVGLDVWSYAVLEENITDTHEELLIWLKQTETEWIRKKDSKENGYNGSYGDGMKGCRHTQESKQKISAHHRHYQSDETKAKLSALGKGRHHTEESKAKISAAKKGVPKTTEQRKAMSDARKGVVPVAAVEGAKEWVKKNGAYWKNHPIPDEAKAHMKAAQQARGTKVIATSPDGTETEYTTMLDAAKGCGLNVGSVASAVKTGGTTRNGYKFKKL